MGMADGGFRSGARCGFRGEPMAAVSPMVRAHDRTEVLSDIAAHPRIKPLTSPHKPQAAPLPVRVRPGFQPTARPRAGRRDGAGSSAPARPRPPRGGKEGGPV